MAQTPTLTLVLEVSTPERPPRRVTLSKAQSIVGRESGDVVLGDPEASALHAEIDTSAGHVIVRDLGSSNGTWRDGERLPQFALYEGQSFHCGNTELKLVSIEGADASIKPGQTAIGKTRVSPDSGPQPPHHDTLVGGPHQRPVAPPPGWTPPSPVSLGTPAPVAETTQVAPAPIESRPTVPAPSSSPTIPGDEEPEDHAESSETIPAHAESRPTVPRSSSTLPGPAGTSSATPSSRTLPTVSTQVPIEPEPAPEPEPQSAPQPAPSPEGAVFRPPVANAVIKSDRDRERAAAPASTPTRSPRRWGRLFAIAGLSALGVGALAGLGYLAYLLLAARDLAFGDRVAQDVPSSAMGFVALRSVDDAVVLLSSDDTDDRFELLRVDALGFDPFDPAAWSSRGVDTTQPVGIALLETTAPIFAVSFGVSDRAKLEAALQDAIPRLSGSDPDEGLWSDRSFGEHGGLWNEEGIAVVHREERSVVVLASRPGWGEDIEKHAKALGSLEPEDSLAQTDAFGSLVSPAGDPVVLAYADGATLRDALPSGGGGDALEARLAMADLDGVGLLLSHEGDAIHMTAEMVVRKGSRHLEVLEKTERDAEALRLLSGPVLLAYDAQLDGSAIDRALAGAVAAVGGSMPVLERDVSKALGVELRADITQNLSGAFGAAVFTLPTGSDDGHGVQAAAWIGVRDESAATETLGRIYEKGFEQLDGLDVAVREYEGTAVYTMPADEARGPELALFVHGGRVWLLVGALPPSMVIDGPQTPFLDEVRHPSLAAVMRKGGNGAGFVDIESALAAVRPSLSTSERDELEALGPILDLFETATTRLEHDGRTVVLTNTLHTAEGVGLRGVLRAVTEHLGASMGIEMARASRASRCAALSKHVVELSRKRLEEAGATQDAVWEIERSAQELCNDPLVTTARLDCYLDADSTQGLSACDALHPVRAKPEHEPDADPEQPEPKLVPYVDDIWPHRVDDPESDTPQPDVNYAIPLGEDPDMRGPEDALVTIVMFGDFECPYCRAVTGTLDEVLAEYGEDVRLVFRHLPLEDIHDDARAAAMAALAASEQGKFWAMYDALYARGNRLDEDMIEAAAREAGLDMERFETDLASAEVGRRLQRDLDAAEKFGLKGTPAFFINGRYLGGRRTASAFGTLIEEERARARTFVERRGETRKRLYEDMLGHFAPEVVEPDTAIAIPPLEGKRHVLDTTGLPQKGAESFAQVEIVECGDFDCPFCARSRKALEQTLDAFPGVTLYFAHNPLDYHPGAEPAARAATAAHAQGKFWEMHDELFKDQRSKARTDEDYKRYAARLGLDVEAFEDDFASEETAAAVAKQQKLCTDNDATATPTFFINGRRVTGAQTAEQLEAIVRSELSEGI